jgi:hypothetical protein
VLIKGLPLGTENLEEIVTLLQVHGSSIKSMKIESVTNSKVKARKWLEMFKKVPNLATLDLDIKNLIMTDWLGGVILQNLKNLTLNLNNCNIKTFFDYIKPNSIETLKVISHWNEFDNFIEKQSKISILKIPGSKVNQTFPRLRLDKFVGFVEYKKGSKILDVSNEFIALMAAHPELKEVKVAHLRKVPNWGIPADFIKALCNLPALEKLDLEVSSDKSYVSELSKCAAKEVNLRFKLSENQTTLQAITDEILKMKNIRELTVEKLQLGRDRKMSETLRDLNVTSYTSCNLNDVLFSLPRLEFLEWGKFSDGYSDESVALIYFKEAVVYPRLKYLKLDHKIFKGSFVMVLEAVPKLQLLLLEARNIPYSTKSINKLLTMPKLKNVIVSFKVNDQESHESDPREILKDVGLIKDLFKKLKKCAIKFIDAPNDLTQKLKAELSSVCNFEIGQGFYDSGFILKSR